MNPVERFSIPEPNSGCWIWLRAIDYDGYGIFTTPSKGKSKNVRAHRLSYEEYNGPIPSGMSVLHKCDNPSCVNPDHLYCGDARDNILDSFRRKRARPQGRTPLSNEDINYILSSGEKTTALAKKFGVHRHTIQLIRSRKIWNWG